MTDIEYRKLSAKEKEEYFSNMNNLEKYEDLKKRNKKFLTEDEKLFIAEMELVLFKNKVKENKEKNKQIWAKNILKPVKEVLMEIYTEKYSKFTDNSNSDEKISAYLIKILNSEDLEKELTNIKEEEYVFKNYKNSITRISKKRKKNLKQDEDVVGEKNE